MNSSEKYILIIYEGKSVCGRGIRTGTTYYTHIHRKGDALTISAMPALDGGPTVGSAVLLLNDICVCVCFCWPKLRLE